MPVISVIIPTFNRAHLLGQAVRSVLDQQFESLEIIIVDDGSTDETPMVVAEMGSSVRYVRQDNKGAAAARNVGVELAKGQYIAFLDSDDLFLPEKLRMQSAVLASDPDVGMVYARALVMDESGVVLSRQWGGDLSGAIYPRMLFMHDSFITTPTVMVRAEVLRQVGGFDESMTVCEDLDLWRRIARRYRVIHLLQPLAVIRERTSEAFNASAMVKARTTYYEKAFAEDPSLAAALKIPLFAEMYYCYGRAAYLSGQSADALDLLREAVRLEPFRLRNIRLLLRCYLMSLVKARK